MRSFAGVEKDRQYSTQMHFIGLEQYQNFLTTFFAKILTSILCAFAIMESEKAPCILEMMINLYKIAEV